MADTKRIFFNGEWYIKTGKGGYYFCVLPNSRRKGASQLHKAVWEFYNERKVPKGHHVHHKDFDKDNNDISNLELLEAKEHLSLHGKKNYEDPECAKRMYANLDAIRPKAAEWHHSPEGLEWHRKHTQESLGKAWEKRYECKCKQCGKSFMSTREDGMYCSDKCGNRCRRGFGIRFPKKCLVCGKDFTAKKKDVGKYCSDKCKGIFKTKRFQESIRVQSDS